MKAHIKYTYAHKVQQAHTVNLHTLDKAESQTQAELYTEHTYNPDRTLIVTLRSGRIIHPIIMHTLTAQTYAFSCQRAKTPHQTLGLKHAPHTAPAPLPIATQEHTDLPYPRARTHTGTCMHTYTHSSPPPLRAEEKGARSGGGEERREDGRARRSQYRGSFPFDLRVLPLCPGPRQ